MTNEPNNSNRAEWARDALAVFTARTYSGDHPDTMDPGDLECAVSDLIADLLHFARQRGLDTEPVLQQARDHFEFEVLEALDYLLEQTVDMDLKYGFELSEGEADARVKALAVIAKARG